MKTRTRTSNSKSKIPFDIFVFRVCLPVSKLSELQNLKKNIWHVIRHNAKDISIDEKNAYLNFRCRGLYRKNFIVQQVKNVLTEFILQESKDGLNYK